MIISVNKIKNTTLVYKQHQSKILSFLFFICTGCVNCKIVSENKNT